MCFNAQPRRLSLRAKRGNLVFLGSPSSLGVPGLFRPATAYGLAAEDFAPRNDNCDEGESKK